MTNHLTSHAHMVSREGRLYMVDLGYGQNRMFEPYLQRLISPQDSTYKYVEAAKDTTIEGPYELPTLQI